MKQSIKYFLATIGIVLGLATPVAVAESTNGCTPTQRAVVRTVWDIADPIVKCLTNSHEVDPDQAMGACNVHEEDKQAARRLLEVKASGAKLGCPSSK